MKRYRFTATYEFNLYSPVSVSGEVDKYEHHQVFLHAMKLLRSTYPGRHPDSIVISIELI